MSHDVLDIEVRPDGAVRVTTGAISAENHVGATRFVNQITRMLGGTTTRRRAPGAPPLPEGVRRVLAQALADALVADYRARTQGTKS